VVAIVGSSMAFLDGTVVNVALPVMQRQLGMTVGLAQWIVEAYALLLSSLVLVGGALGDRLGRKRVYLAGVLLFALASVACGLAPSAVPLIVARAVQGAGAALLVPGSLSLISSAYGEKDRGAAIGTWSAFSAINGRGAGRGRRASATIPALLSSSTRARRGRCAHATVRRGDARRIGAETMDWLGQRSDGRARARRLRADRLGRRTRGTTIGASPWER
jgi:MFS family permease